MTAFDGGGSHLMADFNIACILRRYLLNLCTTLKSMICKLTRKWSGEEFVEQHEQELSFIGLTTTMECTQKTAYNSLYIAETVFVWLRLFNPQTG